MKRAKKDDNQTEIVELLRAHGASVALTHRLGDGFPDIVIGYQGINLLAEIKDGNKKPSARKLTPDEAKFHAEWKGQICVIESVEDALMELRKIQKMRWVLSTNER